jgi:hypothetical protein
MEELASMIKHLSNQEESEGWGKDRKWTNESQLSQHKGKGDLWLCAS